MCPGPRTSPPKGGACSCRGTDQGEPGQGKLNASGVRTLIDDDVELVVLHGRIEVFLDGRVEAMDLVDEEHVSPLEIRQDTGEVAGLFDLRTAGAMDVRIHGTGNDVGESGLSETGRAAEEIVIEDITALAGGFHHQRDSFFNLLLAAELAEDGGTQRDVERAFWSFRRFGVKVLFQGILLLGGESGPAELPPKFKT